MWRPCTYVFLVFTALYMWETSAIEILECTEGECYGSWRKPNNCTYDCKYEVGWCVGSEEVTVKVNAATDDGWIGIGFSESMTNISDIVIAGITSNNDAFIEDRWLIGKGIPQRDTSQDIINASVKRSDGITTMIFTRSRITGDTDHDIELHCQSIFFAWGKEANSNNNRIKTLLPRFEEVSDNDMCFCPTSTVGVTSMTSFKLTPTMPVLMPTSIPTPMPTPMPTPGLCHNCHTLVHKCLLNATCKLLLDEQWEHCINILDWDEFSNETEPVCTSKCKEKLVAVANFFGKESICCICGEITDDHKLSDITSILRCRRIRENVDRWCPNTVNTSCHECEQESTLAESYVTTRCLDVLDTCMQNESCKRLMNDMDRKCKNVHVWNEYNKSDPTCSENCLRAIFELVQNSIGRLWSICNCHVPHTQGTFPSLSKNDAFEEQCFQYQHNRRIFCFHEYSCKGQQFSCQWLVDVCMKDPTCKQLYDNWNEKCVALINWTVDSKTIPICTNECKKADDDLKKHKIWKRSIDCHCGRFDDNAELKDLRQTEKCLRQRVRFAISCDRKVSVECPEDPCEPKMCSTAYEKCSESDSCKRLYEDWEKKCIAVWESTTENCSNECKNATVELYSDLYGQYLRGCDCGMRDLSLYPLLPEEVKCFERQVKMEEVCNIDDTKRCQNCKAEKVCSHSCDKVRFTCTNNTDCNMIWNKYNTYCDGVISWDGNSTIPMCTDECKKWIEELESNPIGKYIKCCHCNKENEVECIRERQNVAIVCDVDFNHVKDCHNNEELCINDTLKNYEGNKDFDGQEHHIMDGSSLTACSGWREKCSDDKCCRKAFHDTFYLCDSVYSWENRTITAPPTCSDRCANALGILSSDHIGKNLRCCKCNKFSDIDQNNLSALKATERCYAGRINLENICKLKISHLSGCNKLPNTFKDPCTVDSCQNALSSCKNNDTCERLYADFVNKCKSVLLPNSTDPVCSHDCKQAIDKLYTNHIGFKLKCCDCGSLSQQNHMIAAHIPNQCFVERFRLIDNCAVDYDECIDCKHKVCPKPCRVVIGQCISNTDCNNSRNNILDKCKDVLSWDGNSSKPQCTDECKTSINNRKLFPALEDADCCTCDDNDCSLQKRNVETLCDVELDSSDECQNKRKACEDKGPKHDHRDQCPPRMCNDCFQRCKDDKLCTRFHNDVHFYCHNVLEWQDDQVEPTCTPVCQMAIDKLALVTTRTMGYNIMCCTCGNYSDTRGNNLIAIRDWEKCKRRIRNVEQFCKHNCTDCNEIRSPRQMASCKLTTRLCNEISECKIMKDKIDGFCSNVFTWERNTNKRPHCSSECKQAWSTMISSSYGRLLCCDCHHNDMTAREKRQCEQQHRNIKEICNLGTESMCDDTCNNNQQNKSEALDDCFDHVERCNRDVQCSGHLFNYTNQCAMAFSGEQMTPDQENVCEEAAKKLFTYKQFGENFTNCKCSAYPELCKELFKNRFLLGKSCSEASDKCRTNATCNKLLNDHNSCMLTDNSCSQTCMIKAVLLYRHRFGKAWWKACSPHYFEQVCFKLY